MLLPRVFNKPNNSIMITVPFLLVTFLISTFTAIGLYSTHHEQKLLTRIEDGYTPVKKSLKQ
jgi:hypothetical protein